MLVFGIGFGLGALLIGVIANRRPQWFARVITVANKVDERLNATIAQK